MLCGQVMQVKKILHISAIISKTDTKALRLCLSDFGRDFRNKLTIFVTKSCPNKILTIQSKFILLKAQSSGQNLPV